MEPDDTSNKQTPEPTIHFECRCGRVYATPALNRDKVLACKHCGAKLTIPMSAVEDADAAHEVQRKMQRVIAAGITIIVLILLGGGFYVYYTLRQDEHRSNLAQYDAYLTDAKKSIQGKDVTTAIAMLQEALALPGDVNKNEAVMLLKDAQSTVQPEKVLQAMSDADFQSLCSTGKLPPSLRLSYDPLNDIYVQRLMAAKDMEASRRKDEATRQAKEEAERKAREAKEEVERKADRAEAELERMRPFAGVVKRRRETAPWTMGEAENCLRLCLDRWILAGDRRTPTMLAEVFSSEPGLRKRITYQDSENLSYFYKLEKYEITERKHITSNPTKVVTDLQTGEGYTVSGDSYEFGVTLTRGDGLTKGKGYHVTMSSNGFSIEVHIEGRQ